MVKVRLENITKRFGNIVAVDNVNLEVGEGDFFTLLGPSGCGKTTVLRIIAGFYTPDDGKVFFDEEEVTSLPPFKRNTGMVFQNYALWPHMSVLGNVAYGLKIRKIPKNEIRERVTRVLRLVGLEGLEKRFPSQLSGGQQQRVALARALVIEPDILLLDEPLSNLDAKLRVQTRTEIKKLQEKLKITTIYVTHDQEEALCVSDRVAVMDRGLIHQIGTPIDIYDRPLVSFVADFIGAANFFRGRMVSFDKAAGTVDVQLHTGLSLKASFSGEESLSEELLLVCRPEAMKILTARDEEVDNVLDGKIKVASYMGDVIRYEVETEHVEGGRLQVDEHNPAKKRIHLEGEPVFIQIPVGNLTIIPRVSN